MEIRKLEEISSASLEAFGNNGYNTDIIFQLSYVTSPDHFGFEFKETKRSYYKNQLTDTEDINDLNELIRKGHSFAAYWENEMVGWIICSIREWNNSCYIENILVSVKFRGKKIGKALIGAAREYARKVGCRLIELETQNTNYPAIQFYLKQGFVISGLNLKLYNKIDECAIYMSQDL